jgi:hypothetical protein
VIEYSIELYDITLSIWNPLAFYASLDNILFTFDPENLKIDIGVTSDSSLARTDPYLLRMKAQI